MMKQQQLYEDYLLTTNQIKLDQLQQFTLQPYQLYTKYKIHPLSNKYRFLLKHAPGSGKTISALLAAKNFIDRGQYAVILTFNKNIFVEDALKFPELGFITVQDSKQLQQTDESKKPEYIKQLIKLFPEKLQFMGYKEFYNTLFWVDQGVIRPNVNMMEQLVNGILICDEVHNTYNIEENNTWGKAIEFISTILKDKVHLLYMTATPLNHPEEIKELLSLMVVTDSYRQLATQKVKIRIRNILEQFIVDQHNNKQDDQVIKSSSYIDKLVLKWIQQSKISEQISIQEAITKYMNKMVSFVPELQDDIPIQKFIGETYQSIPYIQLDRCFIENQQYINYMNTEDYIHDEEYKRHIFFDFPDKIKLEKFIQLYKQQNKNIINWSQQNNINIQTIGEYDYIKGDFLHKNNLSHFSPKFAKMIDYVTTIEGKSFIFTNKVKLTGLHLISNILKANGLIQYKEQPNQNTLCYKCKKQLLKHTDTNHQFIPYTFIQITGKGDIDQKQQLFIFNSVSNIDGQKIQLILGSKKITEGYNLLGVNNVFVMSLPFNIPRLIQVIGRAIRNKSHSMLLPSQRYVNIYLMINSVKQTKNPVNDIQVDQMNEFVTKNIQSHLYGIVTKDELDYFKKIQNYLIIQQYEKLIHQSADDIQLYASLYLNIHNNTYSLNNELRMIPFDQQNDLNEQIDLDEQMMQNYDLSNYYFLRIHVDILSALNNILVQFFNQQSVWILSQLLDEIMKISTIPNIQHINKDQIIFQISQLTGIHFVGDFVIQSNSNDLDIDINMFQEQQTNSIVSIPVELPIQQTSIQLYKMLQKLLDFIININKQYVDTIYQGFIENKRIFSFQWINVLSIQQSQLYFDCLFNIINSGFLNSKNQIDFDKINKTIQQVFIKQYSDKNNKKDIICNQHQLMLVNCKQCEQTYQLYEENKDFQMLLFMSLLYTPVFDRDMFDINDKYTNIIGFLINIDRVMFYDVLTNNWRFNTIIIEQIYDQQIAIKTEQKFSILNIKNILKTRSDVLGIDCISFKMEQLQQIIQTPINQTSKVFLCQQILSEFLVKELTYRFNYTYRKTLILDINTIKGK